MFWTKLVVVAFAGALGAALANRGIALFHDGNRSVAPEVFAGRMPRREFALLAFSSSFGLILGFGIPFSLVSPILLSHGLWLGTDIIGAWFPGPLEALPAASEKTWQKQYLGLFASILSGAAYGVLLVLVIEAVIGLVARLPVNFFSAMTQISGPIIFTLGAIPAVAVAYQYGVRNGVIAFLIALSARQAAVALHLPWPDSWAFLAGAVVLVYHAVQELRCEPAPEETYPVSQEHVWRIRSSLPWLAALGGLYGLASNLSVIMEGPQSLLALAQGDRLAAINYTIARDLSFLPMRTMSILSTGIFTFEGLGFAPAVGLIFPNAILATLAGAVVMSAEALSLVGIAKFFNRYPCMLKAANSLRTAMTRLLELASLVGGMLAANALSPGFGFFAVAGFYLLNEVAGAPVVRAAVGPVSVIMLGIVLNLFAILHLQ